jgi:hypothetical protein
VVNRRPGEKSGRADVEHCDQRGRDVFPDGLTAVTMYSVTMISSPTSLIAWLDDTPRVSVTGIGVVLRADTAERQS